MLQQKWSLNDALNELTSARADMFGLLQPRPRQHPPKTPTPPKPPKKPPIKKPGLKQSEHSDQHTKMATFIMGRRGKTTLMPEISKGHLYKQSVQICTRMRCHGQRKTLWTQTRSPCTWLQDMNTAANRPCR